MKIELKPKNKNEPVWMWNREKLIPCIDEQDESHVENEKSVALLDVQRPQRGTHIVVHRTCQKTGEPLVAIQKRVAFKGLQMSTANGREYSGAQKFETCSDLWRNRQIDKFLLNQF